MGPKKLSLGERIALAASGNQEDEFPEDVEYGETSAKVIELDEDHDALRPVARSSLRAKNVQLLNEFDERYSGEKVSRRKLAETDGIPKSPIKNNSISSSNADEDDFEDDDGDLNDGEELIDDSNSDQDEVRSSEDEVVGVKGEEDVDEEESDDEGESQDEEGSEVEEEEDSDAEESGAQSGIQSLSLRDKQAEIEKGQATLNQLRIWDSLLEVRIRLQKMLLDCNRLPQTAMYEELIGDIAANDQSSTLTKTIEKSEEATKILMYELIRLQEIMTAKHGETKKAVSKKQDHSSEEKLEKDPRKEEITSEDDDNSDTEPNCSPPNRKRKTGAYAMTVKAKQMKPEDFISAAESSFTNFKSYRNQTIQKWNDKTQFAGGKFNRKATAHQISTLRQIEQILSNKDRLLKRTQVRRSNYSLIGEPSRTENEETAEGDEEPNPEVFDDDDFYHQLLRELIERKTSNVNDPLQLSHHWLELQKLRTKLKRKVDTKASKGRKIRYDVHAKLVNFMAPQDNCNMSSAAMKELFSSLFGQTKQ